ncbi:transposase [Streptomyces sp. NBC_01244]|nr:transposase [Streptomyces sp. NBC_01244]
MISPPATGPERERQGEPGAALQRGQGWTSTSCASDARAVWTTRYIDAVVSQLRAEEHAIGDEDIARLSPLKHKDLNVLGRYSFTASTPDGGGLRPLRDPDVVEFDDDEDGHD